MYTFRREMGDFCIGLKVIAILLSAGTGCYRRTAAQLVDAEFDHGYSHRALRLYSQAIRKYRICREAYWRRADIYTRRKQYAKAIADLDQAIRVDSGYNGISCSMHDPLERYKAFKALYKQQLCLIDRDQGLDLALAVCQAIFPDYVRFSLQHDWGDPHMLRRAMDIGAAARTRTITPSEWESCYDDLSRETPDADDFGNFDGSYALNAAAVCLGLLTFIKDGNVQTLVDIGELYNDTVFFRLLESRVPKQLIDHHPLLEEARQWLLELSRLSDV